MAGLFHSRAASSASNWFGILTFAWIVLSGIGTVLSKLSEALLGTLTWPEAILVGAAEGLVVILVIAAVLALAAWAFRLVKPVPANELAEELERTKARLQRAEERLDGAQVAPAVGHASASGRTLPNTRLTEVEREKLSAALHDLHDLLVTRMSDFNGAIGKHGLDVSSATYEIALKGWAEISSNIRRELNKLTQRHGLILDKISASFSRVTHGLMQMDISLREVRRAVVSNWPLEVVTERADKLVADNAALINAVSLAKDTIKEKRREFLD